jgi:flagellar FliL protein
MKAEVKSRGTPPPVRRQEKTADHDHRSVLVRGCGGGGAACVFHDEGRRAYTRKPPRTAKKKKKKRPSPPVYVPLEAFTVNLQPEDGEQYLQRSWTLQVGDLEQSGTDQEQYAESAQPHAAAAVEQARIGNQYAGRQAQAERPKSWSR